MKNMNKIVLGSAMAVALLGQTASAGIVAITANGDINAGTTWTGGVAPVSGDANQWDAAVRVKSITQT